MEVSEEVAARQIYHERNLLLRVLPRFLPWPSLQSVTYQEAHHQIRNVSGQGIQHLSSLTSLLKYSKVLLPCYKCVGVQRLLGERLKQRVRGNS